MLNKDKFNRFSHEQLNSMLEKLRLEAESSSSGVELSPLEKKAILKKKAEKLAEKISEPESISGLEVIEFTLSGETYAIETLFLKEVFHIKEITPVPLTPSFVKGIINLRGNIISVIDVKVFFEMTSGPISNYDRAIILQYGDMIFGIMADEIIGIRQVSLENSSSSLSDLNAIRQKYLKAVTSSRVVILDGYKLLNDKSIIVKDI